MQVYLVGGALREKLLGRAVKERDFVVVGATSEEMLALGYRQVGRDFPVFLHPETQEEYALARTLRNGSAAGRPHADPGVTLEQDLARRDLTINAIAQTAEGELIDPFGGAADLRQRVLRHISPAFADDPLRVLRVARFAARYAALGFTIADETLALMRQLAEVGALDRLVPERVWQELIKALGEADPRPFFDNLRRCGALAQVLPEIDALYGVPQPARWHPEVDCGVHTLMTLAVACELSESPEVRFAALTHDLGKATTPSQILPSHYGHEARGERLVEQLCRRLKAPTRFRELAKVCATYHGYTHRLDELRPKTVVKLLTGLDAFRRPERLRQFLLVCEADYRGRQDFFSRPYPQATELWRLYEAAKGASLAPQEAAQGGWIQGEVLRRERIRLVEARLSTIRDRARLAAEAAEDAKAGDIGADSGTESAKEENQQDT
jgi:tRNA nucleotidyltransferase (CCA-adding enzyme)